MCREMFEKSREKAIIIFEGWNKYFLGMFGLKIQEGNILVEMRSTCRPNEFLFFLN